MDVADLYDHEIAKIGPIWRKLMDEFSRKSNTKENLNELARRATDEFMKAGLVIEVNVSPSLIFNPLTNQYGSPEIVILGRVPGSHFEEEGVPMLDHERKRDEVLKSRERGEDYLGQKGK